MAGHKRKKLDSGSSPYQDPYETKRLHRDNRDRNVHDLVDTYKSLREPSAALRHIHRDSDLSRLFFEIIEQQIMLINSRCQEFDDGRVTVFDKALKELSYNGRTARALGVQELYIREYIGINPEAPSHVIEEALTKNISIKGLLTKFSLAPSERSEKLERYSPPQTDLSKEASKGYPPFNHTDSKTYGILDQDSNVKKDPIIKNNVETLIKQYFTAKKDFYSLKSTNYEENAVAAKYLRDTAENALLYLKSDDDFGSAQLLHELQTVFEYSRSMCVALLGGKKRRFEIEEGPGRVSKPQRHAPFRYSPYPRDHSRDHSRDYSINPTFGDENLLPPRWSPSFSVMASSSYLAPPAKYGSQLADSTSSDAGDTPSTSSSDPQFTPEASGTDEGSPSVRPQLGSPELPKLQTNLGKDNADAVLADETESFLSGDDRSGSDDDDGYDSDKYFRPPPRQRNTSQIGPDYTPEEERGVVKRLDRRLVSFLAFLYMLSFLDRSNIGNAKIAGLSDDLKLSSSQYEWLLTAFYITYILFEWMTLMYKVVPARIYIPLCVFAWGLFASCQALGASFWDMMCLRALLGISEAAFGPGVPFYLSLFYKREELAYRTGLFISAAPLATSFASSLAWLIVKIGDSAPIAPWRLLFLVEGFPSIVVAVFAWLLIPDSPGTARFLTVRQRKIAKLRLQGTKLERHESSDEKFNWRAVRAALFDPTSYLVSLMFLGCNIAFSSMPVFLPTIVKNMGYSSLAAQALSAPPFLVAFVSVLVTASLSDKSRSRSPYLIFHALLSAAAYLVIGLAGYFQSHLPTSLDTIIRYVCVYPAAAGFFSAITIIITWSMDNQVTHEGKGSSVALLNVVGQFGPLIGTRLYPDSDGPLYVRGMLVCAVSMLFVSGLALSLRVVLVRRNRRNSEQEDRMGIEMAEGEGLISSEGRAPAQSRRLVYII
ncbi:putative transporter C1683,12 [Talaromyces islandicus]|uniref:Putative transporter C1683,12 n=1 Tax=Talaromyces islandicus TaxID=28573 RepID=A0A0U1LLB9_TALIS|nr:putative transporter C1683,12 [Talaromyces islandicus]